MILAYLIDFCSYLIPLSFKLQRFSTEGVEVEGYKKSSVKVKSTKMNN
jgi:hypothetical protein